MYRGSSAQLQQQRAARASKQTSWKMLAHYTPVAAAVFGAIHPAYAQEASQAAASDQGLQEIIVTATKQSENIQNAALSVQVLDTAALAQRNVQNFKDYALSLPTVTFSQDQPGFSNVSMRGINVGPSQASGSDPTVGIYLDEQPITTIEGALDLHVYDMQRIEVLPGPQGTLYGAESEAGTIRLITNKPSTREFEAGYDVQANTVAHGTFGSVAEGFVNVPISSNLAARLTGWYERDSGYIDNIPGSITIPNTGYMLDNEGSAAKHWNPTTTYGGRAQLAFDIDDNWTITPSVNAQKTYWGGDFTEEFWKDPSVGSTFSPQLQTRQFSPSNGSDNWIDYALTAQGKIGNFDLTYAGGYVRRDDSRQSSYVDYTLGYQQYAKYFGTPSEQILSVNLSHYQMYSNELRVASPKDYFLRFIAGLFQQRQTHDILDLNPVPGLAQADWVGANVPGGSWTDMWWLTDEQRVDRDTAAFANVNWDITHQLTATVGIRRFHYENTLEGFYGFGLGGFASPGQGSCFIQSSFHGAPCIDLDKRADGSGWTPKYNLEYHITPNVMTYATFSKGFRPGGINRNGALAPYAADYLTNYEIGWKTTFLDNHLRFNGSLYYERWKNFQFNFEGQFNLPEIANAGNAAVKGFEGQLEWAVFSGLTLTEGLAYTDAYLTQNYCGVLGSNGQPITTNPCVVAGKTPFAPLAPDDQQLPFTPRFKNNLSARYTWPLVSDYTAHVQGDLTYQTQVWNDLRTEARNELGPSPAYALTNFFVGVEHGNWQLELLLKNAFNRNASLYRFAECNTTVCAPNVAVYETVAQPRLVGLQFGQHF